MVDTTNEPRRLYSTEVIFHSLMSLFRIIDTTIQIFYRSHLSFIVLCTYGYFALHHY